MDHREIELKLRVEEEKFWDCYTKDPYIRSLARPSDPVQFLLDNLYFDTEYRDLWHAGLALRVRISSDRMEATVKDQGSSHDGLHIRNEWTVPVFSPEAPDPAVFEALDRVAASDTDGGPGIARGIGIARRLRTAIGHQSLQNIVQITFTRSRWILALPGGSRAELAADRGIIRAGGRTEPLEEVELELLSGNPEDLFRVGEELCRRFSLQPEVRSKYARGLRLAGYPDRPE